MDHIRVAPHGCAMGGRPCHGRAGVARRAAVAPAGPKRLPDNESTWIDGLSQRVDIASNFAGPVADRLDPVALVETGLGPLASVETRNTVARAESRAQALVLLLMAPEFLRR